MNYLIMKDGLVKTFAATYMDAINMLRLHPGARIVEQDLRKKTLTLKKETDMNTPNTMAAVKKLVGGKFFHAEFEKKDGSMRKMCCRLGVSRYVKALAPLYEQIKVKDMLIKAIQERINAETILSGDVNRIDQLRAEKKELKATIKATKSQVKVMPSNILTVYEVNAKQYRSIDITRLKMVKCGAKKLILNQV